MTSTEAHDLAMNSVDLEDLEDLVAQSAVLNQPESGSIPQSTSDDSSAAPKESEIMTDLTGPAPGQAPIPAEEPIIADENVTNDALALLQALGK